MSDEKSNGNQLPSCSFSNDISNPELHYAKTNVSKKRTFLETSEDRYEIIDQNVPNNDEHTIKRNKICIDNQSNALDNSFDCYPDPAGDSDAQDLMGAVDSEISNMSLDDAIKKLTSLIEQIENKIFKSNDSKSTFNQENEEIIKTLVHNTEECNEINSQNSSYENNLSYNHVSSHDMINLDGIVENVNFKRDEKIDSIEHIDDVQLLDGHKADACIINKDETCNSESEITYQKENLLKLNHNEHDFIMLNKESSITKIKEENIRNNNNTISIYDQEDKCSNLMKHLEDKMEPEVANHTFPVKEDKKNRKCDLVMMENHEGLLKFSNYLEDVIQFNLSTDTDQSKTNSKSITNQKENLLCESSIVLNKKCILNSGNISTSIADNNNIYERNTCRYLTNQEVELLLESSICSDDDSALDSVKSESIYEDTDIYEKYQSENVNNLEKKLLESSDNIKYMTELNLENVKTCADHTYYKINNFESTLSQKNETSTLPIKVKDDVLSSEFKIKIDSVIITNNEEDLPKLNKSVHSVILDSKKNLYYTDEENINESQEEKFSESIQYLKNKILKEDLNDFSIDGDEKGENNVASYRQFTSDTFFFGSENCPDVLVSYINTTQSPKSFKIKNCPKNSLSTDMEKIHAKFKSSKNIKSESLNQLNVNASSNSPVTKFTNVVEILGTIQSTDSSCIDQSDLINEIISKPDIYKIDEILDEDYPVSPFISQSIAKIINSQNLKKALGKKATNNTNIKDMNKRALCTYLNQQNKILGVLKVLHKSLDTCPLSDVLTEDPKGLVVPLMPHQKHAIAWLMWRESQKPCGGGILADDMGLGKTLSMISLVLKSKEIQTSVPVVSIKNKNDLINGGTLVVCPASLLSQWENEMKTKLSPGLLKIGQYYGVNRIISPSELAKYDIVTTSYHVIMWDFKKWQNSSPLFKINWKRIILDEAHVIRNYKTQTFFAVFNMTSICHWAITGTPIHNKEADFFTLLKFIRCHPFDDWTVWKRWVGNNDDAGRHRLSLLVKSLMLRRTKEELNHFTSFKLPDKVFHTIEIELSKEERIIYEQLLKFSSKLFATYLYDKAEKEKLFDCSINVHYTIQHFQEQSQVKEDIFKDHPQLQKLFKQFQNIKEIQTYHILVLLLRLRQMCCHPCLIKRKVTEENIVKDKKYHILYNEYTADNDTIDSASYNKKSIIVPSKDLNFIEELSISMSCLTLDESKSHPKNNLIDSNLIFKKSWLSSKLKAVCDMVRKKVLISGCKDKAIIVSQWPSMLKIIRKHLSQYDCKMVMFSGEVSVLKKNAIVREFNNINDGPQILLLSLNAGAVGLNLAAANHMFLVDIHWNPQLEAQVCDRIYRLGQTKPVYIYKFICKNTIETRILKIQSQKLEIAQTLFEDIKTSSSNITLDDLKLIFQSN